MDRVYDLRQARIPIGAPSSYRHGQPLLPGLPAACAVADTISDMKPLRILLFLLLCGAGVALGAADDTSSRVRAWRMDHEKQILLELFDFLSIPNVASDRRRHPAQCRRAGSHVRAAPLRAGTDCRPAGRRSSSPNAGCRTSAGRLRSISITTVSPSTRRSGPTNRLSAGDRRGARAGRPDDRPRRVEGRDRSRMAYLRPLVVRRQVADHRVSLRRSKRSTAPNIPLTSNIRVIMEGEEEAGSPHLEAAVRDHARQDPRRRADPRRRSASPERPRDAHFRRPRHGQRD